MAMTTSSTPRNPARKLAAVTLLAASVLTTIIVLLHPEVDAAASVLLAHLHDGLQLWNLVHGLVLVVALAWLFAGAALGLVLFGSKPRTAVVGGVLVAIGSLALAGIGASEIVLAKIAAGTGGVPQPSLAAQFDNGGAVIYLVPAVALLTVGLGVLMFGLSAARAISVPVAVLFVVATIVSNPPIPRAISVPAQILQLVAAVLVAHAVVRPTAKAGTHHPVHTGQVGAPVPEIL